MARLVILIQHPRQVSAAEMETWLRPELQALRGDGVCAVELKRLRSPAERFSATWSWMVELECRDADAARRAVAGGDGLALIADLRLLGLHPSLALVEDAP